MCLRGGARTGGVGRGAEIREPVAAWGKDCPGVGRGFVLITTCLVTGDDGRAAVSDAGGGRGGKPARDVSSRSSKVINMLSVGRTQGWAGWARFLPRRFLAGAAVQGWCGVELTRALGFAPSWCQGSSAWLDAVAAGQRLVKFSTPTVALVEAATRESMSSSSSFIWWRRDILPSSSVIFWLKQSQFKHPDSGLSGGIVVWC